MKRFFDVSISAVVLIVFFPFAVLIAVAIFLSDFGPIFYRQERIGQSGKKFWLWKFRTMKVQQAGEKRHITYGTKDPRITRLGYYLRMLKLDEVPQLLNVIKGEMSLVGPRPEVEKYVNLYNARQRRILELRPGCTDITVLHGHFHDAALLENQHENAELFYINIVMPKKIEHNIFYLKNQSLWLDLKILLGTILLLLRLRPNEPVINDRNLLSGGTH